jgi:hypothetical protein
MTLEQIQTLQTLLAHLREIHRDEFEAWYDQASLLDVHDYTFTGYLIDRALITTRTD